jgi:hypothetical protein
LGDLKLSPKLSGQRNAQQFVIANVTVGAGNAAAAEDEIRAGNFSVTLTNVLASAQSFCRL